jgi:hypothetical protein
MQKGTEGIFLAESESPVKKLEKKLCSKAVNGDRQR